MVPGVPLGYALRTAAMKLGGQPTFNLEEYSYPEKVMGGRNGWLDVYGLMSLNKLRFFTGDMRKAVLAESAFDALDLPKELHRWHPFHRQMYLGARVMLPGHLLASKGDRVAMHSSVETRYPFLDEAVIDFMAKLHPRWKLRGLMKDKYIERKVAERWLPKQIAWRRKVMFRAPMDSWVGADAGKWVDQVLSPESIRKAGFFDVDAVTTARARVPKLRKGSAARQGLEMGLTAVTATQLWSHLYLGGGLCELPTTDAGPPLRAAG